MASTDEKIAAALGGIVDVQSYLLGIRKPSTAFAERVLKSREFAEFQAHRSNLVTLETKSNIIGTGASGDPLTGSTKPYIDAGVRKPLVLRDLLPTYPTDSAAIELPIKSGQTNNAAIQNREGTAHGESAYTFTSSYVPVQTLAHFIPASTQIFEDSATLGSFISTELLAGLAEKVQDQLLNGSGSSSQLTGLLANATAYSAPSPAPTTKLDVLREALLQVETAKFTPNAIILNPANWRTIQTTKGTSVYLAGNPVSGNRCWGLPVITTTDIAAGTYLVGDFNRAAVLFGREAAVFQISRHDNVNFQKGLVTLKASERLALVITNALAMVKGTLP